jgi:predicted ABC-class ATPase
MTHTLLPTLDRIAPSAPAAYLNEGDPQEPDWQSVFYGANYARLSRVKQRYDPSHVLYARTAVGSEAWVEGADGRLCRTGGRGV